MKHANMDYGMRMAGYFMAHAVWCVCKGDTLIPLLAYERDDKVYSLRLEAERLEDGVARGKSWIETNPERADRAVLIYDAYLRLAGSRTDALNATVVEYHPPMQTLGIILPYRHASSADGFAVFRPKVFWTEDQRDREQLAEAFFDGRDTHEEGSKTWFRYLDESA